MCTVSFFETRIRSPERYTVQNTKRTSVPRSKRLTFPMGLWPARRVMKMKDAGRCCIQSEAGFTLAPRVRTKVQDKECRITS